MNVIESRAAKKYQEVRDVLDIDLNPDDWYEKSEKAQAIILKQSKLYMKAQRDTIQKELENYNKNPKNFYSVNMETRKSALKKEDTVIITSLVEATIEVKEFAKNRFFGMSLISLESFQYYCNSKSINSLLWKYMWVSCMNCIILQVNDSILHISLYTFN